MNITITGNLGSGKSSVCKELDKAGFTIVSAGDIFRQIAAEKGMTVIELNEAAKKDRSIDDMLDQRSTKLGKELDHTVFDSRLAWHFVEKSFKVFLLVLPEEAARRVFAGDSRGAEVYRNMEEAKAGLLERATLEQERFRRLYGIDYYDAGNYDLIIESTCATPGQIAQEIRRNFELYCEKPFSAKVELNLGSLCVEGMADGNAGKRNGEDGGKDTGKESGLCADGAVCIVQKDGGYYVSEGQQYVAEAFAQGRVFAEVADISRMRQGEDGGYMVDFSNVFKTPGR